MPLSHTACLAVAALSAGAAGAHLLTSDMGSGAAGGAQPISTVDDNVLIPVLQTAVERLRAKVPLDTGDGAALVHVGHSGRTLTYTLIIALDPGGAEYQVLQLERARTSSICSDRHSQALLNLGVEFRYEVVSSAMTPIAAFVISQRTCDRTI